MNASTDEVPKRSSTEKPPPLEGYHPFAFPKNLKDKLLFLDAFAGAINPFDLWRFVGSQEVSSDEEERKETRQADGPIVKTSNCF